MGCPPDSLTPIVIHDTPAASVLPSGGTQLHSPSRSSRWRQIQATLSPIDISSKPTDAGAAGLASRAGAFACEGREPFLANR